MEQRKQTKTIKQLGKIKNKENKKKQGTNKELREADDLPHQDQCHPGLQCLAHGHRHAEVLWRPRDRRPRHLRPRALRPAGDLLQRDRGDPGLRHHARGDGRGETTRKKRKNKEEQQRRNNKSPNNKSSVPPSRLATSSSSPPCSSEKLLTFRIKGRQDGESAPRSTLAWPGSRRKFTTATQD